MATDLPDMPAAPAAVTPAAGYEFTPAQNELLADLSAKMQGVGFVIALIGILNALAACLVLLGRASDPAIGRLAVPVFASAVIQLVLMAAIYGLVGVWTRNAGFSFRKIVDTKGNDVGHLMDGLRDLYNMYSLLYTVILFAVVVFLAALVIGLVGAFAAPPPAAG